MVWTDIVGRRFSPTELEAYVREQQFAAFRPRFVVVHNTGVPSVKQRPHGFTDQHMRNLVTFYRDTNRWSAGPHAFVDQNGIWIFTPLTVQGVHSPSWNDAALGVETLGDYETEAFDDPIKANLLDCLAVFHRVLDLDPRSLRFHKEDERTTHRTCPGRNMNKAQLVEDLVARLSPRPSDLSPLV